MKKIFNFLLVLFLIIGVTSCENVITIPVLELELDNEEVVINLNAPTPSAIVAVKTGNSGYSAEPEDDKVATVEVKGAEFVITAVNEGTTTITITDKYGKTASVAVTVTYSVPTSSVFTWNGTGVVFEEVGEYGITILAAGVGLTDLETDKRQYILTWSGDFSKGDKSGGKLQIAEPGEALETIPLTTFKILQSEASGNYILFSDGTSSGEFFFTR